MDPDSEPILLNLLADDSPPRPSYEHVVADPMGGSRFRILASPGLVWGVAAGDEIVVDTETGRFEIVARGGNICVQVYGDPGLIDVGDKMTGLGGWCDGSNRNLTVFTVPVSVGFPAIESVFSGLVDRHPSLVWYYTNVFDNDVVQTLDSGVGLVGYAAVR